MIFQHQECFFRYNGKIAILGWRCFSCFGKTRRWLLDGNRSGKICFKLNVEIISDVFSLVSEA